MVVRLEDVVLTGDLKPKTEIAAPVRLIYRFGTVTRVLIGSALLIYAGAAAFLTIKAGEESGAFLIILGSGACLAPALGLFVILYPKLSLTDTAVTCRMPFGTRILQTTQISGYRISNSSHGRVTTLVPECLTDRPMRIHPYFDTDQSFLDWIARFPLMPDT